MKTMVPGSIQEEDNARFRRQVPIARRRIFGNNNTMIRRLCSEQYNQGFSEFGAVRD
jgi:hypothetical protein